MNNKITIYELLGLVKDGQAPKRIEYDTEKYIWEAKLKEYRRYPYDNNLYYSLWSDYDLTKCLNDEVEILDNEDEEKNKVPTEEEVEMLGYKVAKIVKAYQKGVNIALEENDNEDEDIEEIKEILRYGDLHCPYGNNESMFWKNIIINQNKINELVRKINKLKKEGK